MLLLRSKEPRYNRTLLFRAKPVQAFAWSPEARERSLKAEL